MKATFKGKFLPAWTLSEKGIEYKGEIYPFSKIVRLGETISPASKMQNGVIQIYIIGKNVPITLSYSFDQQKEAAEAIKYLRENVGDEETRREYKEKEMRETSGLVYDLIGVRGKYMKVYENRVIIGAKTGVGSLLTGNVSDGEKTIYYADCIGVQFKESGFQIGYLQLETASGIMNMQQSNFFNENSFTFDTSVQSNRKMNEVADYIRGRVESIKNKSNQGSQISSADELKKFKELLDSGIISQEEFDAKKKQLLGI